MRSHWSSMRSYLSPRGWGGYPSHTRLRPLSHVMRSHWWTVTSCLCLIGTQSRASEHKRPREGLVGLSVYGPRKPEKAKQEDKKKKTRKERCKKKELKEKLKKNKEAARKRKGKLLSKLPQLLGLAAARTERRCSKEGPLRPYPRAPRQGIS